MLAAHPADEAMRRELAPPPARYLKRLTVPLGAEMRAVAPAEIAHLRADTKDTSVVTSHGGFLMKSSLRRLHDKLDAQSSRRSTAAWR